MCSPCFDPAWAGVSAADFISHEWQAIYLHIKKLKSAESKLASHFGLSYQRNTWNFTNNRQ
jgi:hypothetical protein